MASALGATTRGKDLLEGHFKAELQDWPYILFCYRIIKFQDTIAERTLEDNILSTFVIFTNEQSEAWKAAERVP